MKKSAKDKSNKNISNMDDVERQTKSCIDKILGDVSKKSASKQLLLGLSSGWLTGFVTARFSKVIGVAVGGGIILLEIANEKGYIKINWDKVNKKIDKVSDTLEEKITGQGPSWTDKVERFVDRKASKAQEGVKAGQAKAKHWYSNFVGESECKLTAAHIFLASFVAGIAIGFGTAK